MKFVVAGDWHGDAQWANRCIRAVSEAGFDTLFHMGDFGIWHGPDGGKYRTSVSKSATRNGVRLVFLDGNHENFDILEKLVKKSKHVSDEGFYELYPGLEYSPRGNTWEWGGRRFMSMGGAASIDKQWRVVHEQQTDERVWWPQEEITDADVALGCAAGKIDVLFAHDSIIRPPDMPHNYKFDAMSRASRDRLMQVARATRPELLVHGHWHTRDNYRSETGVRIAALHCDNTALELNLAVLDTDDLSVVGWR